MTVDMSVYNFGSALLEKHIIDVENLQSKLLLLVSSCTAAPFKSHSQRMELSLDHMRELLSVCVAQKSHDTCLEWVGWWVDGCAEHLL